MNTIADQWKFFEASVVPKNASSIQRQEMRRAFYAGAVSMLTMHLGLGDDSVSEAAAVGILKGWQEECALFAHHIATGKA